MLLATLICSAGLRRRRGKTGLPCAVGDAGQPGPQFPMRAPVDWAQEIPRTSRCSWLSWPASTEVGK